MTRKQPREQRLNEIVSAAVAEFLERGYENASMAAMAARAGLTKGGLYHHFRSKDELLGYANLRLTEPVMEFAERARRSPSARAGLRRYIRSYLQFWAARPRELAFFFLTMTKALAMPAMKELYAGYYREMLAIFSGLFARAIEDGELRRHDPAARALALLTALDGVIAYLALDSEANVDHAVRRLQDVFVDELAPRPGRKGTGRS
jgi:AcrR family transcriptional regulator